MSTTTNPTPQTPRITSLTPLPTSTGRWLSLNHITYTDSTGTSRTWETCNRTTTSSSGIDAVAIGNILLSPRHPPSTILVLQFRPPVNAMTVEWPAGLIDGDETPEEAAVRELKEETGYVGKVVGRSISVASDPGMSGSTMCLVMVEVDLEGEEAGGLGGNAGGLGAQVGEDAMPKQSLDDGEEIQRVRVELRDLHDKLEEYAANGYVVAAKLYHWAAGVNFAMERGDLFR